MEFYQQFIGRVSNEALMNKPLRIGDKHFFSELRGFCTIRLQVVWRPQGSKTWILCKYVCVTGSSSIVGLDVAIVLFLFTLIFSQILAILLVKQLIVLKVLHQNVKLRKGKIKH